ncbi:MAG TPA: sugar ABC transporter permease [Firmicutes bacterium]|jgi:raffinose/stachyose/melibiose transport system permease protein|nr:sugar ABC transporter permease [Bacillota bacterium]
MKIIPQTIADPIKEKQPRRKKNLVQNEAGIVSRLFFGVVLSLFSVLSILPLVWLALSSFKTTQEFQMNRLGLPINWFFKNYLFAWKIGNMGTLVLNSLFYTSISTIAVIFFSLAAAFAFAKIKSKATPFLYGSFVIGILLTIQSIMVPLFLMANTVNLLDTRLGVLIPYVGLGLPLGVYLCTEYVKSIHDSIVESARIDGAGYFKIFGVIILPMAKPVVSTLAILNVLAVWNEFMMINILVSRETLKSLPVGIMKFSSALSSDYGKQFAALVIGLLPLLLFYLVFRNKITEGVSAGAVKG